MKNEQTITNKRPISLYSSHAAHLCSAQTLLCTKTAQKQFLVLVINYAVKCPVLFCCILVNMVRKYKRRTERRKFTAADLQDAARKVNEDKRSIRSVAKEAGICHVTLNRYIKKHRDGIPSSIPSYNTESKQVFSEAQESELESYI